MTGGDKAQGRQVSVDEVMNRVLAAEHDARLAVAECRAEAARIVAEADARARALAGRSEARIKVAHRIADGAIGRALAELAQVPLASGPDEEPKTAAGGDAASVPQPLARAIRSLADEIIGGAA
jgi:regulator of protease activity HflC (stomatin/prohibitin superfamily)